MNQPDIRIYSDIQALSHACSKLLADELAAVVTSTNAATFVLAGGATPRGVYALLAAEPCRTSPEWSRIHFYWGDERCVPPDSADSNFRMAYDALISKVPTTESLIHRIRGELENAEQAAHLYEAEIRELLPNSPVPAFDVVLLGMGEDGHTASLFPGAHWDEQRLVVPCVGPHFPTLRVSLTPMLLNAAHRVIFLASGIRKAPALAKVIEDPSCNYPAARIHPVSGRLTWMIDRAAASLLH